MLASMSSEVDVAHSRFDASKRRFSDGLGRARNCNDGAVVIRVHFTAQEIDVAD
jgi:hypothetical protein